VKRDWGKRKERNLGGRFCPKPRIPIRRIEKQAQKKIGGVKKCEQWVRDGGPGGLRS